MIIKTIILLLLSLLSYYSSHYNHWIGDNYYESSIMTDYIIIRPYWKKTGWIRTLTTPITSYNYNSSYEYNYLHEKCFI